MGEECIFRPDPPPRLCKGYRFSGQTAVYSNGLVLSKSLGVSEIQAPYYAKGNYNTYFMEFVRIERVIFENI